MKNELTALSLTCAFTAVLWMPYVLNRIAVGGLRKTVGYPEEPVALAPWAKRLKSAHLNAVENLVVFATLLLTAEFAGYSGPILAFAANLYLGARIVHALAYTLALPWVRTLAFAGGFAAQMLVAWELLVR